eukprot:7937680-Heterocapsa_arctica.AAC.1
MVVPTCATGRSSLPGLVVKEGLELGRSGEGSAKIYVDLLRLVALSAHRLGGLHLRTLNFVSSVS